MWLKMGCLDIVVEEGDFSRLLFFFAAKCLQCAAPCLNSAPCRRSQGLLELGAGGGAIAPFPDFAR